MRAVAAELGLYAKFAADASGVSIEVPAQKVVLEEVDMNSLFGVLLEPLFEMELSYSAVASPEFALRVVAARSRADQSRLAALRDAREGRTTRVNLGSL